MNEEQYCSLFVLLLRGSTNNVIGKKNMANPSREEP